MRIDGRLNRAGLTTRQIFFIECWSNFCHKNSIDTDRVSYNNALSAMRELLPAIGMERNMQLSPFSSFDDESKFAQVNDFMYS